MSPTASSSSAREAFADAAAGVTGSLVSMLTFYPIDVLKTNLQASNVHDVNDENNKQQSKQQNEMKMKAKTEEAESKLFPFRKWNKDILTMAFIKSLFRGIHLKTAHTVTSSFTYFFIYSFIKAQHKKHYATRSSNNKTIYKPSTSSRLLLSALAGMVNVTLTFPLDVLAARSQTKNKELGDEEEIEEQAQAKAPLTVKHDGKRKRETASNTTVIQHTSCTLKCNQRMKITNREEEEKDEKANDDNDDYDNSDDSNAEIQHIMDQVWNNNNNNINNNDNQDTCSNSNSNHSDKNRDNNNDEKNQNNMKEYATVGDDCEKDDDNENNEEEEEEKIEKEEVEQQICNPHHMIHCPSFYQTIPPQQQQLMDKTSSIVGTTVSHTNNNMNMQSSRSIKSINVEQNCSISDKDNVQNDNIFHNDHDNATSTSSRLRNSKNQQQQATIQSMSSSSSFRNMHILELWSGIQPALLLCSNPAINFTVFDIVKEHLITYKQRYHFKQFSGLQQQHYHQQQVSMMEAFLIGLIAKFSATIVTYPLIRAKVMLMVANNKNMRDDIQKNNHHDHDDDHDNDNSQYNHNQQQHKQSTMIYILCDIFRKEGIQGLFKGCGLQLVHTMLKSALLMMVKEKINATTRRLIVGAYDTTS